MIREAIDFIVIVGAAGAAVCIFAMTCALAVL